MFIVLTAMAVTIESEAKRIFADQTTNPSAVQFRNVRKTGDVVCGEINRPNREGGFNGFQRFVYRSKENWALQMAGGYRLNDGGRFTDSEFLIERATYRPNMTTGELRVATELLREASTADERAAEMFKACT